MFSSVYCTAYVPVYLANWTCTYSVTHQFHSLHKPLIPRNAVTRVSGDMLKKVRKNTVCNHRKVEPIQITPMCKTIARVGYVQTTEHYPTVKCVT